MVQKIFITSVIVIIIMLGMILWKMTESEQVQYPIETSAYESKQVVPKTNIAVPFRKVDKIAQQNQIKEQNQTIQEQLATDVEQIAPAAFGFLKQGDVLQVVGLLCENDRNGRLMQYIDQLCQKRECIIDVAYQADIIDAKWQESIVDILKLFEAEEVRDGSIFIEANSVKLDGEVVDAKSAVLLQKYLSDLKATGLDLKNNIAIDTYSVQTQPKEVLKEPAEENTSQKRTTNVHNSKIIQKPVEKKWDVVKTRKTYLRKEHVKRVRHIPKKVVEDIIAPSYMETSIDLNRRISDRSVERGSETAIPTKSKEDMIAEPKLEILY